MHELINVWYDWAALAFPHLESLSHGVCFFSHCMHPGQRSDLDQLLVFLPHLFDITLQSNTHHTKSLNQLFINLRALAGIRILVVVAEFPKHELLNEFVPS